MTNDTKKPIGLASLTPEELARLNLGIPGPDATIRNFWKNHATPTQDETIERVKQAIGKVFIPSGVWNIEEGRKLEAAAKAALSAMPDHITDESKMLSPEDSLIKFSDDGKGKWQSHEAMLNITDSTTMGLYDLVATGWGKNKEEAKRNLMAQLKLLMQHFAKELP